MGLNVVDRGHHGDLRNSITVFGLKIWHMVDALSFGLIEPDGRGMTRDLI